jgi:hypothetical protein
MVTNLDDILRIIIIIPANILLELRAVILLFKKWNTLYACARRVFFLEYLGCVGAAPPIYTPVAGLIPPCTTGGGGDAFADFFAIVGYILLLNISCIVGVGSSYRVI